MVGSSSRKVRTWLLIPPSNGRCEPYTLPLVNSRKREQQRGDLLERAYILPVIFVVTSALRTDRGDGWSDMINISRRLG